MTDCAMTFRLAGGPCDGQKLRLPTRWDGSGHRPQPVIEALPNDYYNLPLPDSMADVIATTETVTKHLYHLHIFDKGRDRWYEYRPERQEGRFY